MKKTFNKILYSAVLSCLLLIVFQTVCFAENGTPYDGYIVKFKSAPVMMAEESDGNQFSPIVKDENIYTVTNESEEFIDSLSQDQNVEYIEPNYIISLPDNEEITDINIIPESNNSNMAVLNSISSFTQPNDTYYYNQWNMEMIKSPYWWQYGLDTKSVKIGIIDSGSPDRHPDITQNIAPGVDYTGTGIYDTYGHSTFISGIIASDTNNRIGTAGILPSSTIIPFKVFTEKKTDSAKVIKAFYDAVDVYECDVINLSLTFDNYIESFKYAVEHAVSKNIIVVAAVGNDGNKETATATKIKYPAGYDNVIGVGSLTYSKNRASHSQYNTSVDVMAPGESIYGSSLTEDDKKNLIHSYSRGTGTSYATPHVAAAAAIAKYFNKDITPAKFLELIAKTSDHLGDEGKNPEYGYGALNIQNIIETLSPSFAPAPTSAPVSSYKLHTEIYPLVFDAGLNSSKSSVQIYNDTNENKIVDCYVVSYTETSDANGEFVEHVTGSIVKNDIELPANGHKTLPSLVLPIDKTGTRSLIRVFIWNDNMQPLMPPYEYEVKY